jgi:uncharacterized protein YraI
MTWLLKKLLFVVTIICSAQFVFAQQISKRVNVDLLNVRSGPGTDYSIVDKVYNSDKLDIIYESGQWSKVRLNNGNIGFVYSAYLSNVNQNTGNSRNTNPYENWISLYLRTGDAPPCSIVDAKYNFSLDNYLKVNVGSNTDVVIKIMRLVDDECIRIAYIGSKNSFSMTNIPEGRYYLKIAYGKELKQDKNEEDCIIKFSKQALYEKGTDILDFNREHSYNGYSLPCFELSLDVISSSPQNGFNSKTINEDEFNK